MSQRKALSTRAVTAQDLPDRMNREIIPVLRQLLPGTAVTGSVSGDTLFILRTLLEILGNAGVITDETTL